MEFTITSDEEFLHVQISGREANVPPHQLCAAVFNASEKQGRRRILLELDQKTPLSSGAQYALISKLPELGFTPQHRIAMVHKRAEMQKANEFIDVVSGNRGLAVRNFPSVEDAKTWLREQPEG